MKNVCSILSAALLVCAPALADDAATITVQADRPGIAVSPSLWGIFFEDIGRAVDGGIYAELIQNRNFEDDAKGPLAWSAVTGDGRSSALALVDDQPLNEVNPRALRVTVGGRGPGAAGVANGGFHGIAVRKGETYVLSFHAFAENGFKGPLQVRLEGYGQLLADAELTLKGDGWARYDCVLKARGTDPQARLALVTPAEGTFRLDMVSLFPKATWKARPNGLRPDLAELLLGLKPAFVRFPGGCWVEGATLETAYRWKTTVGDPAKRRHVWNLWDYMSSNGIGYHEYLQMTEDLGAEALFVVNCGMSHKEQREQPKSLAGVEEYVQDALDAIEYANGPADSKWGAMRAANGHPAPFRLRYVEIGNENGGPAYNARYQLFYDAIRAKYPDILLIANVWGGRPGTCEIIDEHYYSNPEFFIQNFRKYDTYDRTGPKVYVGEYAVTQGCGNGNLRGALGEAVFMMGMERNSDIVTMASYAPLFANVHAKRWNPDLIYFDAARSCVIPSYHVQRLFAEHRPDTVLPVDVKAPPPVPEAKNGGVGVGTWVTQAEYKDLKVEADGKTLFASDFTAGSKGWKTHGGTWKTADGALVQTSNDEGGIRATAGEPKWSRYTLSLKARKTGGAEGFLVLFHVRDDRNYGWLNLGGWSNSRHALEVTQGGGKVELGDAVPGRIETGRWYDIRIETDGARIKTFLDGKQLHDVAYGATEALYAAAGRAGDDVIVKAVNVSSRPIAAEFNLAGVASVAPRGAAVVLTSDDPADENTLENPDRVSPRTTEIRDASARFKRTLPAHSLTVLRLKARK